MRRSYIKDLVSPYFLTLIAVLLLGFFIRIYRISEVPPSLNWDEVSHGYNAYSILKTGKDEWGEFLPLIFRAYGDYKLPVYIYVTSVSVFLFGLTEFAVRLPSVLAGIGTVVFSYFLIREIFSKKKVNSPHTIHNAQLAAILAAFLVAVEPWTFFLSRGAFEANLALFFFTSGMYFFFRCSNSQFADHRSLLISAVMFGLTFWTYNSYRIFAPIMIVVLVLVFKNELANIYKKSRLAVYSFFVVIFIFFVPMLYQLFFGEGQARYGEVKILDSGTIAKIEEQRNLGGSRFVHNRYTYVASAFVKNYFSHFSPSFLVTNGGSHYQFSLPGRGLINPINYLFLLVGILYFLISKVFGKRIKILLFAWLLLAPIPSSITREAPHVLRAITFLPLPMVFSSLGLIFLISKVRSNFSLAILFGYFLFSVLWFGNFWVEYSRSYPKKFSQSWQYGYKEAVEYAKANYDDYDKIIITKKYGEPHEFFLFYTKLDPEAYRNDQNLNRFYQSNWYWVDGFDKFYFVNDWQVKDRDSEFDLESGDIVECTNSNCLLITSFDNAPGGWNKLETINFLDGNPAFEIYEN